MIKLKQRLLFVHKGIEQTTFPHLMNTDKVRADNQTGITKGISLTEGFTLICKVVPSPLWLVQSACQRMPTKKWPSSEHLLPQIPPSRRPHPPRSVSLTHPPFLLPGHPASTTSLPPSTLSRSLSFSPSCLTARCDPSCTSRSPQQTLGVWRRSGVQAWLRLHSSLCTEEACPAGL